MIGKTLAHYRVVEKIGVGGMGEVYRASDTKLQRDVAIKVLPSEAAADVEKRSRFDREALAVAALKHPNIVTIHGVDEVDGLHFIVMELVEGRTLSEAIPAEGLPLERFFEIALALTDALGAAHERGVLHRDLKPANVMLDEAGRVKVLDFGLAKFWESAGPDEGLTMPGYTETRGGQILGTAAYMSPEQAQGKAVDARSDVFSLGIILYEMATGKRPFDGDTGISVISSILKDEPPSATKLNPRLPRHLARIIAHCMVKDPERRYQSAKELRNELESLKREIDSGELEAPVDTPGARRRVGRLAVWALAPVALALGIFLFFRPGPPSTPVPSTPLPPEQLTVGVIGFENLSDPSDAANLGRMLVALVTTHLAESGRVAVASMPRILEALEREQRGGPFDPKLAAVAARRADLGLMIVGQVGHLGDRLVLTAELIDVKSGQTLGSHQDRGASTEDLFTMAGNVAEHLIALAPESGKQVGADVDLAEVLTSSPEAYRQYVAGELALHEGDWERSLQYFQQAIATDSTFATAYYRAAIATWWSARGDEEVRSFLDRGLPHVGRLPARWRTLFQALRDFLAQRMSSAEAALSELVATGAGMPDAYYLLGEIQTHAQQFVDPGAARKNFEKALELDPTFRVVSYHLIDGYLEARDLAGAERLLARFDASGPEDPARLGVEAMLRLAEGRYEEAVSVAQRLRHLVDGRGELERPRWVLARAGRFDLAMELASMDPADEVSRRMQIEGRAEAWASRGRLRQAAEDLEVAARGFRQRTGLGGRAAQLLVERAVALSLLGDHDAAVEAAMEGVRTERQYTYAHFGLGWARLRADDVAGAEEALDGLEKVIPELEDPYPEVCARLLRADLLLTSGEPAKAQAELDPLLRIPPEYRPFLWEYLLRGRVREALGDPEGAVDAYKTAIDPVTLAESRIILGVLGLYHLARAEESAGHLAAARGHYEEFLRRWEDADPEITQVEDARRRLAKLAG